MDMQRIRSILESNLQTGSWVRLLLVDDESSVERVGSVLRLADYGRFELHESSRIVLSAIRDHGHANNRWLASRVPDVLRNRNVRLRLTRREDLGGLVDFCLGNFCAIELAQSESVVHSSSER